MTTVVIMTFLVALVSPLQAKMELLLPVPGTMVQVSSPLNPPILKGIKVNPNDPLKFEFILDQGSNNQSQPGDISRRDVSSSLLPNELGLNAKAPEGTKQAHRSDKFTDHQLRQESTKLIKYFLASLTTPEKDLWVNLSPYEKDRIVPESFGQTEMGRDLLAQDYILKQLTASLIYPEGDIGKKFWKRVYQASGNKNVSINTFNKVWIVPDKAVVYENAKTGSAYIVESSLKVLTEQDYLSNEKNKVQKSNNHIVRDIVIPQLTRDVNEGGNFVQLRQVYHSLILATWYKNKIRRSLLSQVYSDKNKTTGIAYEGDLHTYKIYQQYLEAFKKGTYNYIKDEQDPITKQLIPRKYFAGGAIMQVGGILELTGTVDQIKPLDQAMNISMMLQDSSSSLRKITQDAAQTHTSPEGQPFYFEGMSGLNSTQVRMKLFGPEIDTWLSLQEKNGKKLMLENTVNDLLDDEKFLTLLENSELENVAFETVKYLVNHEKFSKSTIGTKNLLSLFRGIRQKLKYQNNSFYKKVPVISYPIEAFVDYMSYIAMIQPFLESDGFYKFLPNERMMAIMDEFNRQKFVLSADNFAQNYDVLPKQVSLKFFKKDIQKIELPRKTYQTFLEAINTQDIQNFLNDPSFLDTEQTPKNDRFILLIAKIIDLGFDLQGENLGHLFSALPLWLTDTVKRDDFSLIKLPLNVFYQLRSALDKDVVIKHIESKRFRRLDPSKKTVDLIKFIQSKGFILETDNPDHIVSALPERLSDHVYKKDFNRVGVTLIVFDQLTSILKNAEMKKFLEGEFSTINPYLRMAAFVREAIRLGLPLNSHHLGHLYSALPLQLTKGVYKSGILKVDLSLEVFTQLQNALNDKRVQDYIFVDDFEGTLLGKRVPSLIKKIKALGLKLDTSNALGVFTALPPDVKRLVRALDRSSDEENSQDKAMKGGIDLNASKIDLQIQHADEAIKFQVDPAMLNRLQNSSGFTPVIIKIQPLLDVKAFLGIVSPI